jgi:hypothetical protein
MPPVHQNSECENKTIELLKPIYESPAAKKDCPLLIDKILSLYQ